MEDEQTAAIREAFSMFDQDGDGTIHPDELGKVFASLGQQVTDTELKDMVQEVDLNENGTIEFSEFYNLWIRDRDSQTEEEELRASFNVFDQDGSGAINKSELEKVMKNLDPAVTEDDLKEMMDEADQNQDGKIDYEEFCRLMKSK